MPFGYADKLSYREDLGDALGAPELTEEEKELEAKITQLAKWVRDAKRIFAFTGAGISTACGVPDFRGPNGIWTLQKQGLPTPELNISLPHVAPSLTHMLLSKWVQEGKCAYVCSQNVDSLHLRSGIPRDRLAELHGNCFSEMCQRPSCRAEYIRDFEMDTVGHKVTGRSCSRPGCRGRLKDNVLDWEQPLSDEELERSEAEARTADLTLVLGSSLQIVPAADIPTLTAKHGGNVVILNLQETPRDHHASLLIRAKCDDVLGRVCRHLGCAVPDFARRDQFCIRLVVTELVPAAAAAAPRRKKPTPNTAAATTTGALVVLGSENDAVEIKSDPGASADVPERNRILVVDAWVHNTAGTDAPLPHVESIAMTLALASAHRPPSPPETAEGEHVPEEGEHCASHPPFRCVQEISVGPDSSDSLQVALSLRLCRWMDADARDVSVRIGFATWNDALAAPRPAGGSAMAGTGGSRSGMRPKSDDIEIEIDDGAPAEGRGPERAHVQVTVTAGPAGGEVEPGGGWDAGAGPAMKRPVGYRVGRRGGWGWRVGVVTQRRTYPVPV